jgi:hypothetical protein
MGQLICKFRVSRGRYRFESIDAMESFKISSNCLFEFDSCNLDNPDDAASVFGVESLEPSSVGLVDVLNINPDSDDNLCCYVTAEVEVRFEVDNSIESIESWLTDNSSEFNICGRITCEGEDGLDGADSEEFIWPWDL